MLGVPSCFLLHSYCRLVGTFYVRLLAISTLRFLLFAFHFLVLTTYCNTFDFVLFAAPSYTDFAFRFPPACYFLLSPFQHPTPHLLATCCLLLLSSYLYLLLSSYSFPYHVPLGSFWCLLPVMPRQTLIQSNTEFTFDMIWTEQRSEMLWNPFSPRVWLIVGPTPERERNFFAGHTCVHPKYLFRPSRMTPLPHFRKGPNCAQARIMLPSILAAYAVEFKLFS